MFFAFWIHIVIGSYYYRQFCMELNGLAVKLQVFLSIFYFSVI